ncbi:MAG: hypothetical protein KDD64_00880 [Bdellovibrionales bacterium]|nr:hypothetical protein [Bdellovibrionales bacterium]
MNGKTFTLLLSVLFLSFLGLVFGLGGTLFRDLKSSPEAILHVNHLSKSFAERNAFETEKGSLLELYHKPTETLVMIATESKAGIADWTLGTATEAKEIFSVARDFRISKSTPIQEHEFIIKYLAAQIDLRRSEIQKESAERNSIALVQSDTLFYRLAFLHPNTLLVLKSSKQVPTEVEFDRILSLLAQNQRVE